MSYIVICCVDEQKVLAVVVVFATFFCLLSRCYLPAHLSQFRNLSDSYLGPMDLTDFQWRAFRRSLPQMMLFAFASVGVTQLMFRVVLPLVDSELRRAQLARYVRLATTLAFIAFLHRQQTVFLVLLLAIHFVVVVALGDRAVGGVRLAVVFTWLFTLAFLATSDDRQYDVRFSQLLGEEFSSWVRIEYKKIVVDF